MKEKTKETIKNLGVAATAGIPILGGPISVILDKYLPEFVEQRRGNFLNQLNDELEVLLKSELETDTESDRFISIFIRCVKLALEEYEQEKIDAFRNIILNSSLPSKQDFDLTTLMMNWVREFSVDQIRIIKAVKENPSIANYSEHSDLYYALKDFFPEIPKLFLITLSQDLITKNIVLYGKGKIQNEIPNESGKFWYLSEVGEAFVDYITKPV